MHINVHLRTLSNGEDHPAARCPTLSYSRRDTRVDRISFVSVTSSRLAILMRLQDGRHVVIWDWRSGETLFALEDNNYNTVDFIDDYRLLVGINPYVEGAPVQTFFHCSYHPVHSFFDSYWTMLEQGAHKPSPAEYMAPFCHDPSQRIVVLYAQYFSRYAIFRLETLLKLAEGREGCDIGWDEWKDHVVITSISSDSSVDVWVSGSRLFSIVTGGYGLSELEVYDFSLQGCAKYLSEEVDAGFGVRCLLPTGPKVQLPWDVEELVDTRCGHDSVAFLCIPDGYTGESVLHIWSF